MPSILEALLCQLKLWSITEMTSDTQSEMLNWIKILENLSDSHKMILKYPLFGLDESDKISKYLREDARRSKE